MVGDLFIGGGYYTHDKLSFGSILAKDEDFDIHKLELKHILKPKFSYDKDYVLLLGLKGIERILRKSRLDKKKVHKIIKSFLNSIPPKKPLVVLDDWSLAMLKRHGNDIRSYLIKNFNVKLYLLRECLSTEKYPKNVVSFTTPGEDHSKLSKPHSDKNLDFFFQGNISSPDRSAIVPKIEKFTRKYRCKYKLMTGGVKNTKDRLSLKDFLRTMADSHCCLHFCGSGYDCFRYHEIASVGSIIVTPDYPWVVGNDYKDMHSKVVFGNIEELKSKLNKLMESDDLVAEIEHNALCNFKKYHTCSVRHQELKKLIDQYVKT